MATMNGKSKVLVVGSEPDLMEMTQKALGPSFELLYASNEKDGLEKARKDIPDAIVLGYIEPRGTSFELHRKLRRGWITKNIPLLVVDVSPEEHARKGWTKDEGMQMDADGYVSLDRGNIAAISALVEPAIARPRVNNASAVDYASSIFREDYYALPDLSESSLLKEKVDTRLREKANTLREALLNPGTFCVTWEQIPGRGAFERQQEEIIENVEKAAKGGKVHAVSVTDNPGGNPAISTEMLCAEIKKLGIEPLVHLACRDKNRNELESVMYGLAAAGVRNVLLLTGDAPASGGFNGKSKSVFDLDPMHGLQLVGMMNQGMEQEVMRRKVTLAATDFFAGACVSPFKKLEAELMAQYFKLGKKIQAGAQFIITQVGYDARKFHELLLWTKLNGNNVSLLVNIYVLPYATAKVMNANQIPGCVVTDKLVAELAEEAKAKDKGKAARLLRAAKMYAIAKGMGYAGAHIGGHGITYEMVEYIVDKGEELSASWEALVAEFDYPQENGFYYFKKDPQTGLNLPELAERARKPAMPFKYRLYRMAHHLLFNEKSRAFRVLQPVAKRIDASHAGKKAFGYVEHMSKVAMFGCMNCGDCALFDAAYICPMSHCPKSQRNGPCGGSCDGWCEVYPNERKCIWVLAYERLKSAGEEKKIGAYIVPPCNWDLWETPSWLNFYLGRDHSAKRLGIKPPQEKKSKPTAGEVSPAPGVKNGVRA